MCKELPKLKVRWWYLGCVAEETTYDFEQAKHSLFSHPGILLWVEGQTIRSYEDLAQLASQDDCKDKEFLEAVAMVPIGGG